MADDAEIRGLRAAMTKRKPITERMKIDALLNLMWIDNGFECKVCAEPIKPESPIDWDHALPLALGGEHHYGNLRPLHRACHAVKTRGTGATTAGSDIGKIKKMRHILTGKMVPVKPTLKCIGCGQEHDNPSMLCERGLAPATYIKPKRKLQGRGFSKQHRPMRGGT